MWRNYPCPLNKEILQSPGVLSKFRTKEEDMVAGVIILTPLVDTATALNVDTILSRK